MSQNLTRQGMDSAINVANVLVGLALAVSPWVLGYHGATAAQWNALVVGAIVALIAIRALAALAEWEEWANLALGIWLVTSPWTLGFNGVGAAAYAHVAAGAIVAILAALEVWLINHRPMSTA